jgi:hypothetical protein
LADQPIVVQTLHGNHASFPGMRDGEFRRGRILQVAGDGPHGVIELIGLYDRHAHDSAISHAGNCDHFVILDQR